jgi:putative SOS response-associated peptidase YedK
MAWYVFYVINEKKGGFGFFSWHNIDNSRRRVKVTMCGRYSLIVIDDLGKRFRIYDPTLGIRSHFNIAPSQTMPVIVRHECIRMVMMQWGLIPHWVKDPKKSMHPINAKAETLAEKPMFCGLLKSKRCLVPASGFYEWKTEGTRKIPYYIHLKDSPVFAIAGLYDVWYDTFNEAHPTYTIITTNANELVRPLHDRMPAILKREDESRWLDGDIPASDEMKRILSPYPSGEMDVYPVSSRVNSPDADDERLIQPLVTL